MTSNEATGPTLLKGKHNSAQSDNKFHVTLKINETKTTRRKNKNFSGESRFLFI